MKILFVCRQNVGRSQMAKAFYNSLTKSNDSNAAGTHVLEHGKTFQERKAASKSKNFYVLDVMNEIGIDMSGYVRRPLSADALVGYDVIVSMANKKVSHDLLKIYPRLSYLLFIEYCWLFFQ